MTPKEKALTRAETVRLVSTGALVVTPACEACGTPGVFARCYRQGLRPGQIVNLVLHHVDYADPALVIPLCLGCHQRVHFGSIPEPRTGRVYAGRKAGPPKGRGYRGLPKAIRPNHWQVGLACSECASPFVAGDRVRRVPNPRGDALLHVQCVGAYTAHVTTQEAA